MKNGAGCFSGVAGWLSRAPGEQAGAPCPSRKQGRKAAAASGGPAGKETCEAAKRFADPGSKLHKSSARTAQRNRSVLSRTEPSEPVDESTQCDFSDQFVASAMKARPDAPAWNGRKSLPVDNRAATRLSEAPDTRPERTMEPPRVLKTAANAPNTWVEAELDPWPKPPSAPVERRLPAAHFERVPPWRQMGLHIDLPKSTTSRTVEHPFVHETRTSIQQTNAKAAASHDGARGHVAKGKDETARSAPFTHWRSGPFELVDAFKAAPPRGSPELPQEEAHASKAEIFAPGQAHFGPLCRAPSVPSGPFSLSSNVSDGNVSDASGSVLSQSEGNSSKHTLAGESWSKHRVLPWTKPYMTEPPGPCAQSDARGRNQTPSSSQARIQSWCRRSRWTPRHAPVRDLCREVSEPPQSHAPNPPPQAPGRARQAVSTSSKILEALYSHDADDWRIPSRIRDRDHKLAASLQLLCGSACAIDADSARNSDSVIERNQTYLDMYAPATLMRAGLVDPSCVQA